MTYIFDPNEPGVLVAGNACIFRSSDSHSGRRLPWTHTDFLLSADKELVS